MLLSSIDLGCSEEVLTIVAMLSADQVFYRPKEKQNEADQKRSKFLQIEVRVRMVMLWPLLSSTSLQGDHLTLLNVYEAWKRNRFSAPWCYENFLHARTLKRAQDIRKQLVTICDRYKVRLALDLCNFPF